VLDRVERRQPRAVEEELARERRPIEGSRAEDLVAHAGDADRSPALERHAPDGA